MGIIQEWLKRRFSKNEKLALPQAEEKENASDVSMSSKHEKFASGISVTIEQTENDDELEKMGYTRYQPKIFLNCNPNWRRWYKSPLLRSEYYNGHVSGDENKKAINEGALKVEQKEDGKNIISTIKCKYIKREGAELYEFELGRAKGMIFKNVMQEVDTILAIQATKMYSGSMLEKEIKRHYEELCKMKDFEISNIGELILSSTGENIYIPQNIKNDQLYDKRVDLSDIPTKQTVSQMQVPCEQADVEKKSFSEIEKNVEQLYEYCKLAIQIGVFDDDDWKKIDDSYYLAKILNGNKIIKAEEMPRDVRDVIYDRKPNLQKESYEEIEKKYFTSEQYGILGDIIKEKIKSTQHYGIISSNDVKEMAIKEIVIEEMKKLPLKYEGYILTYQYTYDSNPEYAEKIELLQDMINHSKIKFLEERGISIERKNEKQNEKQNESEQK